MRSTSSAIANSVAGDSSDGAARTAGQRLVREDVAGAEIDDRLVHAGQAVAEDDVLQRRAIAMRLALAQVARVLRRVGDQARGEALGAEQRVAEHARASRP